MRASSCRATTIISEPANGGLSADRVKEDQDDLCHHTPKLGQAITHFGAPLHAWQQRKGVSKLLGAPAPVGNDVSSIVRMLVIFHNHSDRYVPALAGLRQSARKNERRIRHQPIRTNSGEPLRPGISRAHVTQLACRPVRGSHMQQHRALCTPGVQLPSYRRMGTFASLSLRCPCVSCA